MNKKRIVVLGGGYAGIQAAQKMHKLFKRRKDIDITLIDKNPFHTLITELHEVAGSRVDENAIKIPYNNIFEYTNVNVIQGYINEVNPDEQIITLEHDKIRYDYLVIATGSEASSFDIPGIDEYAFKLWSLEDALKIKHHIINMFETASKEQNINRKKQLLTFVIGGAGYTGVEMCGEFVHWLPFLARKYNINEKEITLTIVEALPNILHTLKPKLAKKAERFLKKYNVNIITNEPIVELTSDAVILKSNKKIHTNTLIWTSGVQSNSFVKSTNLNLGCKNRIQVNSHQQVENHPNIYAIGDNALSIDEGCNEVMPFVEAALQTADVAAKNIFSEITGSKEKEEFNPRFHGIMVSIGSKYAVADIMNIGLQGVPATLMKHLVNIHYLFGIGGIEACINYFKSHFFNRTKENNKFWSITSKHVHAKSHSYWLAFARLCLAYVWLVSAFDKISHGWITNNGILVSGATPQLISPNSPGFYVWFVENLIYPNSLFFQNMIVITELLIGIAFLLGAFTFIAGLASMFMIINFFLSGTGDFYLFIAHIPMLGGAGRSLGLDRHLMPYLMRQLRYLQRNGKLKLKV